MKSPVRVGLAAIYIFFLITGVANGITISDSTFSAEVNTEYVWEVVPTEYGDDTYVGDQYKLKINNVSKGIYDSKDSLIVYGTIEFYDHRLDSTVIEVNNSFLLAYNSTQLYLEFCYYFENYPIAFVVPTPVEYDLIANALIISPGYSPPYYLEYTTEGTLIYVNQDYYTKYMLFFNENGLLSKFERRYNNIPRYRIELIDNNQNPVDNGQSIPFGNFSLNIVIIIITVFMIIKKKKIFFRKT